MADNTIIIINIKYYKKKSLRKSNVIFHTIIR